MEILLKILETVFYFIIIFLIVIQYIKMKKYKMFYAFSTYEKDIEPKTLKQKLDDFMEIDTSLEMSEEEKQKKADFVLQMAKYTGKSFKVAFIHYLIIGMFSSQFFLFLILFSINAFPFRVKKYTSSRKIGEIKYLTKTIFNILMLIFILINKYILEINFLNFLHL